MEKNEIYFTVAIVVVIILIIVAIVLVIMRHKVANNLANQPYGLLRYTPRDLDQYHMVAKMMEGGENHFPYDVLYDSEQQKRNIESQLKNRNYIASSLMLPRLMERLGHLA